MTVSVGEFSCRGVQLTEPMRLLERPTQHPFLGSFNCAQYLMAPSPCSVHQFIQAMGLNTWASGVKFPARFVPH